MQRVKKKSIRRLLIWGLVVCSIIALLALSFRPVPIEVDVADVTSGSLFVSINEDGQTRIKERYTVSSPLSGRLSRVTLKAGDNVKASETMIALVEPSDPQLLDARTRTETEAHVKAAEANAQRATADREHAKSAEAFTRREWERNQALHQDALISTATYEESRYQAQAAASALRSAELAEQMAAYELDQARAALLRGEHAPVADESRFPIPAPIDGKVLRVYQQSSTVLATGSPVVELGDPTDLEVIVDVLSTDAVKIAPGANVLIEHWGGSKALNGKVRLVEPAAFTKISALGVEEQRVWIVIDFTDPLEQRSRLGDGFRVEARIIVWEGENLVKVPTGALFRHGESWAVFLYANGIAELRAVTPGESDGIETAIQSGLTPGDRVILHPSERIEAGVKVQIRSFSK